MGVGRAGTGEILLPAALWAAILNVHVGVKVPMNLHCPVGDSGAAPIPPALNLGLLRVLRPAFSFVPIVSSITPLAILLVAFRLPFLAPVGEPTHLRGSERVKVRVEMYPCRLHIIDVQHLVASLHPAFSRPLSPPNPGSVFFSNSAAREDDGGRRLGGLGGLDCLTRLAPGTVRCIVISDVSALFLESLTGSF